MRSPITIGILLLAMFLASPPARAQEAHWEFDGVTFHPRAGWCAALSQVQGAQVIAASPCGHPMPSMNAGVISGVMSQAEFDAHAAAVVQRSDSQEVQNRAAQQMQGCTSSAFRVDHDPLHGTSNAFEVNAQWQCADGPRHFVTLTMYVRGQSGRVWMIAFDHPDSAISADDRTMLQGVAGAIQGAG